MPIFSAFVFPSATDEENLALWTAEFEKRAEKTGQIFDPDVVQLDLQRWMTEIRRGNKAIKRNPTEYRDVVELHEAMKDFRTKREKELASKKQADEGKKSLFTINDFEVIEASTPQALSELASLGSNWCVKNVQTADSYLRKRGAFKIVLKQGLPFVALTKNEVWYKTDYNLRNGKNYGERIKPIIQQQDFQTLNSVLERLNLPMLSDAKFKVVESLNEVGILQKAIKTGKYAQADKLLYNLVKPSDEVLKILASDATLSIMWARRSQRRFKLGEPVILQDSHATNEYYSLMSTAFKVKEWPEAEPILMKDPMTAYGYARASGKDSWPEAEPYIFQDAIATVLYATQVSHKRVPPAVEEKLVKDLGYSEEMGVTTGPQQLLSYVKAFPETASLFVRSFSHNPREAVDFAIAVKPQRFPELETVIVEDLRSLWRYTDMALDGQRFPLGEKALLQRGDQWAILSYLKTVWDNTSTRIPELEKKVAKDPESLVYLCTEILDQPIPEWEPLLEEKAELHELLRYMRAFQRPFYGALKRFSEEEEFLITQTSISQQASPEADIFFVRKAVLQLPNYLRLVTLPAGLTDDDHWKRLFPYVKDLPERAVEVAHLLGQSNLPENLEKKIAKLPVAASNYVGKFLQKRWPEGEAAIAKNPDFAFHYFTRYLVPAGFTEWPEAEPAIFTDSLNAFLYAVKYAKKRIPEAEKAIAMTPWIALEYAQKVLKGPFREAEASMRRDLSVWFGYQDFLASQGYDRAGGKG